MPDNHPHNVLRDTITRLIAEGAEPITEVRPTVYGYDGLAYGVGDRVELHPGTDLWMRGARYGVVVSLSLTPKDRVKVLVDKTGRKISGTADTFKIAG